MDDLKICLPEEIKKKQFQGLDGLRGISILLVLIAHVFKNDKGYWYFGQMGVSIFFVISGFLITTLLLKEKATIGRINLKNFYIRRGLRIIPLVYLFLIVLLFLKIVYALPIPGKSFVTSFLFIRNLSRVDDWYTTHLWTLGIEEQYYLIFPFLLTLLPLRLYKSITILLIILFPILSYIYYKRIDVEVLHLNRFFHVALANADRLFGKGTAMILIGSLFSMLFLTGSRFIKWLYEKAPGILSVVLFIASIPLCFPVFPKYLGLVSDSLFGISTAIVIILNLKEQSLFSRLLNLEVLKKIGILSYSLYIWQQLFTHQQPWGGNLFLNLTALAIVAFLSYYFYEKKFLQYKELFKKI
jgi:peptidoglycan/LPS O-acetylase OafA/YrhL